ncbi:MAG TPA: uracil-DNA glycosylase family protein [Stellaceae bacterium]|jgi:uracil-DNA glycosylase|nr:uracil-DNA glycosylase family protein [Stellaceae bacterium]
MISADVPDSSGASVDGDFDRLLVELRSCTLCAAVLPLGPRPVVRGRPSARLLIISQAPGTRVHETGLSFDDRSGDRLRDWLAVDRDIFYDEAQVAIMGMGFCYPGRIEGRSGGDRPPRPECAPAWHPRLLPYFAETRLTLLIGSYAIRYYLPDTRRTSMSASLKLWREFLPRFFVLPHPSWRTTAWERANPWFAGEVLPALRARVTAALR